MEANLDLPDGVAGPVTQLISRATGVAFSAFFVMQPAGFPLREHLLVVGVELAHPLPTVTEPTMILLGGFDPDEGTEPGQRVPQTGLLAWKYPQNPSEDLRSLLGSVDLDAQLRF